MVVKVLFKGQFDTDSGHLMMTSVIVETIVEVVNEGVGLVTGDTSVVLDLLNGNEVNKTLVVEEELVVLGPVLWLDVDTTTNVDEDDAAEDAVEDEERTVRDELLKISEHGTTVVAVVTRVTVKVLLAVKGQSLTKEGHLVIVSTSVEIIVDVVKEPGVDELLLRGETTVEVVVIAGSEVVALEYTDVVLLEYGTIVVAVLTRVVVNVLCIVNGQSVTEAGHFVIVSTMVENKIAVVNDAGTDEVLF